HQELPPKHENANQADDKPRIGATLDQTKHGDDRLGTTLATAPSLSVTAPSVHLLTSCDQAQANVGNTPPATSATSCQPARLPEKRAATSRPISRHHQRSAAPPGAGRVHCRVGQKQSEGIP